jgi:hypothetical protein
VVDPNYYDTGTGSLVAVPSNDYTIQRIFYCGCLDASFIHYGQNTYPSLSSAEAALVGEDIELDPNIVAEASLRSFIIVKEGTTDLTDTDDVKFISANKFGLGPAGGISFATTDLQGAYNNGVEPEITLNATRGALSIQDAAAPLGANLFEISSNGKATDYFTVDSEKAIFDGYISLSEAASDPTEVGNKGHLYTKEDDAYGTTELFYMDDTGSITQLTQDGYLATYNSLRGIRLLDGTEITPAAGSIGLYAKDVSGTAELFFSDAIGNKIQMTNVGEMAGTALVDGYLPLIARTDPDSADGYGAIYSKEIDGYVELMYLDSYGNVIQITRSGTLAGIGTREDEFTADSPDGYGRQTFSLTIATGTEMDTPSTYNMVGIFVNGVRHKWVSADPDVREYAMADTSSVTVGGLSTDDEVEIVYGGEAAQSSGSGSGSGIVVWNHIELTQPSGMATAAEALWQFDDGASSLLDLTGNSHTMVLQTGEEQYVEYEPGSVGLFFDGASTYQANLSTNLRVLGALTLELVGIIMLRTATQMTLLAMQGDPINDTETNNFLYTIRTEGIVMKINSFWEYGAGANSSYTAEYGLLAGDFTGMIQSLKITNAEFTDAQVLAAYNSVRGL